MTCPTDGSYPMVLAARVHEEVRRLFDHRVLERCWYDGTRMCRNGPGCDEGCPLRKLADMVGINPREDGGLPPYDYWQRPLRDGAGSEAEA